MNTHMKDVRLAPAVLLISDDETLVDVVRSIVKSPWKLVRHRGTELMSREAFAKPNVRLAVLDDQRLKENERASILAQIRKHFSGVTLLYIAGIQSEDNEKLARTNGAQYYVSKPLSLERFGHVLQSFLQAQRVDEPSVNSGKEKPATSARESRAEDSSHLGAGIRRLAKELNREDSLLRFHMLDAALAGLRLGRNPESPELRSDVAKIFKSLIQRVCGEFQFMRQLESEIRRCSVAASDMTEGLRLEEEVRRCVEPA